MQKSKKLKLKKVEKKGDEKEEGKQGNKNVKRKANQTQIEEQSKYRRNKNK